MKKYYTKSNNANDIMKQIIYFLIAVLLIWNATATAYDHSCTDSDGGKNYHIKGNCVDYDQSEMDYCNGYNYIQEWYCFSGCMDFPMEASSELQGHDPNCIWGCYDGRCASNGEIIESLGLIYTPGECLDTDGGIDKFTDGICIDSDGKYYIEQCNKGNVEEYYCESNMCKRAFGEQDTYCPGGTGEMQDQGGCEAGACKKVDETLSGCCFNPDTVACEWIDKRDDCCPVFGDYEKDLPFGPDKTTDCINNWFFKTEKSEECPPKLDVFENSKHCLNGCCCFRDPEGVAHATILPQLVCKWWQPFEAVEEFGCVDSYCEEIVPIVEAGIVPPKATTTILQESPTTINIQEPEGTGLNTFQISIIIFIILVLFILAALFLL